MDLLFGALVVILCGCFGAYSGSSGTSKGFRRYGIPSLIAIYGTVFHSPWCLLSLAMIGILVLGYGVPSPGKDSGSDLGRFWYKVTQERPMIDILIRGTVALFVILTMLYAPLISHAWPVYVVSALAFLSVHILFAAVVEGEPVINLGNKQFLIEDLLVYINMSWFCVLNIMLI